MKFNFTITSTIEVKEEKIKYDLQEIERFINKNLVGDTFGSSIDEFYLGYEIADPKGKLKHYQQTANLKRYGRRYLLIVKQFDYREGKDKNFMGQFNILKNKILEAISDTEKLKRKPKDFNNQKFYDVIKNILKNYENALSLT